MTYIDTHVHLDEVLSMLRRREKVPSTCKAWMELSNEERTHWRALGWTRGQWEGIPFTDRKRNPTWDTAWVKLTEVQREAAQAIGFDQAIWESCEWPMRGGFSMTTAWDEFSAEERASMEALGETPESWEKYRDVKGLNDGRGAGPNGNLCTWRQLNAPGKEAAEKLGFYEAVFDLEEMADLRQSVDVFGKDFGGCIAQGCDERSLPLARQLAIEHPRVFAAFGIHPKIALTYNEGLEGRILEAFAACGQKAVAWGEIGLDYSHDYYGRLQWARKKQRAVFARQLQLAVARGLPLVLHLRSAERDTIRILRRWVPRDYKAHVHSYLGSVALMVELLREWPNFMVGFSGTITYSHAGELCRHCPLERMLLETDAPYLGLFNVSFSHPGQIPEIADLVGQRLGRSARDVLIATTANARKMYGI